MSYGIKKEGPGLGEGRIIELGSLFSGIGGIELGFERAGGFKTIWNCETDPYASAVLKKHWPSVPNLGDIEKVKWAKVKSPGIITGGFPCQDISNAGKRAGITGKKSGLWKEYAKAVRILRPRYVFIENVPALLSRGLSVVIADLATCGYDVEWDCIPAKAVGAPHRRDRLFILAYAQGQRKRRISKGQGTEREREANPYRKGPDVPNTISDRRRQASNRQFKPDGSLANADSERLQKPKSPGIFEGGRQDLNQFAIRYGQGKGYWAVEPAICRVVNGLPFRVDRIKCLGNAVVPQVAQFIAERIKAMERKINEPAR